MALNVPTFFKRLGSSVVFVAIMLTGLLWNEWTFLALVCLINFLCFKEFIRLMQKIDSESYWPKWIPEIIQMAGFIWLFMILLATGVLNDFSIIMHHCVYAFALIFIPVFMLAAILSKRTAWQACMQALFGLLYIVMPMTLLIILWRYHHLLPLFMILLIWVNDTMAYLVGSFIGRTPFSSISPKKTWEGTIGAAILTIAASIAIGHFYAPGNSNIKFDLPDFAFLGMIVSVAGPAGDLLKSKFKRLAGVKDYGNLMPGHGGALDRFDSLLLVTPFVFVYVVYFVL